MEQAILSELQKLTLLTMLGVKRVLTMNDVSLLTGLSKSHIYKLVCARKVPHYKSDGNKFTYFLKDEIESWLLAHRIPTNEEIDQQATSYVVTGRMQKGGSK